jgi:hypothetical protein
LGGVFSRSVKRSSRSKEEDEERKQKLENGKKKLTRVGFEPTPQERLRPEHSVLDHSTISPSVQLVPDRRTSPHRTALFKLRKRGKKGKTRQAKTHDWMRPHRVESTSSRPL